MTLGQFREMTAEWPDHAPMMLEDVDGEFIDMVEESWSLDGLRAIYLINEYLVGNL